MQYGLCNFWAAVGRSGGSLYAMAETDTSVDSSLAFCACLPLHAFAFHFGLTPPLLMTGVSPIVCNDLHMDFSVGKMHLHPGS